MDIYEFNLSFLWDKKHSINGLLLLLITGISGYLCADFRSNHSLDVFSRPKRMGSTTPCCKKAGQPTATTSAIDC